MEKVLQILVVLILLMLFITYYIRVEKTRFRPYYAVGRFTAPGDLLWNLPGIDPDNQLLFLAKNEGMAGNEGITGNENMSANEGIVEVLDSNTRELITSISVGADPGAQVFDTETRLLYSANGEGTVSVIRQVSRDTYKILQTLNTRQGCRLLALDTRSKKIYLPVKGILPGMEVPMLPVAGRSDPETGSLSGETGPIPFRDIDCWVYTNQ